MNPKTDPSSKPRFALLLATGFGLGYLPIAPGSWGSLAGVALAVVPWGLWLLAALAVPAGISVGVATNLGGWRVDPFVFWNCVCSVVIAVVGVCTAGHAMKHLGTKDPAAIVIDEISGQHLSLLIAGFWANPISTSDVLWINHPLGPLGLFDPNWKYFLLGFILFRVFDIWKPFPARRAESLPGGWGIMADDWIAGIYAALGLWVIRALSVQ